jgi:hypothetical protein
MGKVGGALQALPPSVAFALPPLDEVVPLCGWMIYAVTQQTHHPSVLQPAGFPKAVAVSQPIEASFQ